VTTSGPTGLTWDEFAAAIAAIVQVPVADVQPDARLIEGLNVDSLALSELIVALIVDFEMEGLSENLEERKWGSVTAGELYEEYRDRHHRPRSSNRFRFDDS
jgi:acyl carrier protein